MDPRDVAKSDADIRHSRKGLLGDQSAIGFVVLESRDHLHKFVVFEQGFFGNGFPGGFQPRNNAHLQTADDGEETIVVGEFEQLGRYFDEPNDKQSASVQLGRGDNSRGNPVCKFVEMGNQIMNVGRRKRSMWSSPAFVDKLMTLNGIEPERIGQR